ncbi:SpoIIE family protein phosphatase [Rhodocaloribacter litoris]|uniref:SpoIIE family protein phosphatase n=1 Tax=Rhodocaloribacter litoris TaxID=2558931 RepID=UPI001423263A|nr:SpoIIE family protein phosphatase [Rhodocaloribacter litoris]QXD15476.1 SpoIIE family protein phosphatase [Rhodocaloribacter litoris]
MPEASPPVRQTERFDLRALHETSQLLSTSLDLEFVLNNLLLTAMSKLLVTRGVALLHDPVEDGYEVAAVKGIANLRCGERLRLDGEARGALLRDEAVPEALAVHRVVLVLPIVFGHRHIGFVGLGGKMTGEAFSNKELEFVQSLVNMASAAVHNSLMVAELRQANRDLDAKVQQLNTLFDLSQEFNATVDRERLVHLLSLALMGQLLVGKYLFLMGEREGEARPHAFRIVTARGVGEDPVEPELIEALCELKTMLLLQDEAEADPRWDGLRRRGLVLALPIRHQGETCAMLCLGPKRTGLPYRPDDVEFLTALGNLAFVSLQNAFLVEQQIEKERLEEEMRLARAIQMKLQPQRLPALRGLEIAAVALPSRYVAGDYYDVLRLDDDRLLLAIADVTGKGLPASLLMSNLQACIHVMAPMDITLEEAVAHANRVVCENTDYDKFITLCTGIYDARDRSFQYVNAGHNPPVLVRDDGSVALLEKGGLLLGVFSASTYERGTVTLAPGDVLVLFTDGVTEAMSPGGEEYGEERLEAVLKAHRRASAPALLDAVLADVRRFTGEASALSDDLTMIVVKAER